MSATLNGRRAFARLAIACLATILGALCAAPIVRLSPAWAQEGAVAAWRVECTGDGKTLDCRAVQQMFNRDDKQLVLQLSARSSGADKTPTLALNLPLGISVTEPIQIKIDNGAVERYPVQTCTATGCIVNVPLKEPLMAAMRSGTLLKITMQAPDKRALTVDVPLLGFGLAYDKAK
jgi:invasion protein IalB